MKMNGNNKKISDRGLTQDQADVLNRIIDQARERQLSLEELDQVFDKAREPFYKDGKIKRG